MADDEAGRANRQSTRIESFEHYLHNSTIHGLSNIVEAKSSYARGFWLMVFLCMLTTSMVSVGRLINDYLQEKTYLVQRNHIVKDLEFPAITLCNANNVLKSKHTRHFDDSFLNASLKHGNLLLPLMYLDDEAIKINNLTSVQEKRSASKMLFPKGLNGWCTFASFQNCSANDFIDTIANSFIGFCKTFNTDGKYKQKRPGPLSGLKMKLYINQEDYESHIQFDIGAGVQLKVHPRNVFPDFHYDEGVLLQPGTVTLIKIGRQLHKRVINCTERKDNGYFPGNYHHTSCETLCVNKQMEENCNILDATSLYYSQQKQDRTHLKQNKSDPYCLTHVYTKALRGGISCQCPLPCLEEKYTITASSSKWPTTADIRYYRVMLEKILNRTDITDEFVYNNLLSVYVYYDSISYETIREEFAVSPASLYASIGGIIGLFIGASFYSFSEFFIFLGTTLFINKRKTAPEENK